MRPGDVGELNALAIDEIEDKVYIDPSIRAGVNSPSTSCPIVVVAECALCLRSLMQTSRSSSIGYILASPLLYVYNTL